MYFFKRSILIVEDDYDTYQNLVKFFKDKGLNVFETEDKSPVDSYEMALRIVKEDNPDIAIIDVELKYKEGDKKDGIDLCLAIKKQFNTFIIILTGSGDTTYPRKARMALTNDYVRKIPKTHDYEQLWASLQVHFPFGETADKDKSSLFNVQEKGGSYRTLERKMIEWGKLAWVRSDNAKMGIGPNNNVELKVVEPDKVYISRKTIKEVMEILPDNFIQVNRSQIINKNHITSAKSKWVFCVGDEDFKVTLGFQLSVKRKLKL